MQMLFNHFIIKILPFLPLSVIRVIAGRYVAGEHAEDVLNVVKTLNQQGFSATVDILGEHTNNVNTARDITREYMAILSSIYDQSLNCNISIKPSHLGMDVSTECIKENMTHLIETARQNSQFIRIDMEDSSLTDDTIQLYTKCKEQYEKIGTVLQAYLFRSANDLSELKNKNRFNVRICKGIYRESSDISIQSRHDINNNFLKLLRFAFENNIYVCIATHDQFLIKESYKLIKDLKIPNDRFEFQVLFGVPVSGWLKKHLKHGYKVRVYVPFGRDWYDYSIRRMKENPNIIGYVLRNIFRK